MSIRSYTGSSKTIPPGGEIVIVNKDGVMSNVKGIVCGVEPDRGTGSAGEVLTAVGDGTMSWQTGGGSGTPTSLAVALNNGNIASQDILMAGYDISSDADMGVSSQTKVVVSAPTVEVTGGADLTLIAAGQCALGSTGGQVLIDAQDKTIFGCDVDIANHNLTDVAQITGGLGGLNIDGESRFISDYPTVDATAAGQPTLAEQLAPKSYVDSAVAGAVGVSLTAENTFTAVNTFQAGAIIKQTGYGSSYDISNPGQSHTAFNNTTNSQFELNFRKTLAVWNTTTADGYIVLPTPDQGLDGCEFTAVAMYSDLTLRCLVGGTDGQMLNFTNYGQHNYETDVGSARIRAGRSINFGCCRVTGANTYRWCLFSTSDPQFEVWGQLPP